MNILPTPSPSPKPNQNKLKLYKRASLLAQITIFYNLIEGITSVFFGFSDETISLFGFGIDSFIEGQKGCGGCHTLGLRDQEARKSEGRKYYRYGMDCQNCHTRHAFSKKEFEVERKRFTDICQQCHSPNFVTQNMKNADLMIKESDRLLAEAIEIIAGLYKDNIIKDKKENTAYPDLLTFYEVNTKIEQILYEMFMDHRMKTFQGAFHLNYDYSTWYGYAKMKKDLV